MTASDTGISTAEVLGTFVEGVIVVDRDARILYANAAASALFGVAIGALETTTLHDPRWSRLEVDGTRAEPGNSVALRSLADGINRTEVPVGLRRADGGVLWLLLSTRLLRVAEDPLGPAVVCLLRDMTGTRLADERRRVSEGHFRTAAAAAPFAVFELDHQGRIVFVTERWQDLTGYDPESVVGVPPTALCPPEEQGRMRDAISVAGLEHRHTHLRHHLVRTDGRVIPVLSNIAPLIEGDLVVGYLGSVADCSEDGRSGRRPADPQAHAVHPGADDDRQPLEHRSEQARRLAEIGELSAGIAHDFGNLLAVIQNSAVMVQRSTTLSPDTRADVARIRAAAETGTALTGRLLSLGRHVHAPQAVPVAGLVAEVGSLLHGVLGDTVVVATDLSADTTVFADPSEAQRMLVNLALNARDAMPEGGTITISARHHAAAGESDMVVLAVADTGDGMSEDVLGQAFEPFFSTKTAGATRGMGLPSVRRIAEQDGGWLTISSAPGAGTEVEVYLPAAGKPHAPSPRN